MSDDRQLLRQFADQNSQEAFAELVGRHVGWIFQSALRRTDQRHDLAHEIVQQVFLSLARHAGSLSRHVCLGGWLFTTTRYAANRLLRAEARRRRYEVASQAMTEPETSVAENWTEMRPMLDQAMDGLPARDRETLLQRFFEGKALAEIAATQGVSEDGIRKRVDRALERLRLILARRGVASTASALTAVLSAQAQATAPAEVQLVAVNAASAGAAAPSIITSVVFHLMNAKTGAWIGATAIIGAGVALTSVTLRSPAHPETVPAIVSRAPIPNSPAPMPASRGVSRPTLRDDGRAFLAQYPEIRPMLADMFRAQFTRNFALFYLKAGLTATQIATFESARIERALATLEVTASSINAGNPDIPESELVAILGEPGLREWKVFNRQWVADYFAKNVAASVRNGATPLTPGQMLQILDVVSRNSREFQAGQTVSPTNVSWPETIVQMSAVMTPEQWSQAQVWIQQTHVNAELEAARGQLPQGTKLDVGEFFAARPELWSAYQQATVGRLHQTYDSFFARLELSPAQLEQAFALLRQDKIDEMDLAMAAQTLTSAKGDPASRAYRETQRMELRQSLEALLGTENYRRLQDYNRVLGVQSVAEEVAGFVTALEGPMNAAQTERLTRVLAESSADYRNGRNAALKTVDWDAALAQATGLLSPRQMAALHAKAQQMRSAAYLERFFAK